MNLIAIGDNVADCYLNKKLYYPGGNAVNVAVSSIWNGAVQAAYIGVFGTDDAAEHIRSCLQKERVDISHSRTLVGRTGMPGVTIAPDGDRLFSDRAPGSVQDVVRLRLTEEDYSYIRGYDVAHTCLYSHLEPELPALSKVIPVSFDFSDDYSDSLVDACCPYLKFAFFSGSGKSQAVLDALAKRVMDMGVSVVGITLGKQGAVFYQGGKRFEQPIKPANVVDAMGAGDHFIAGFLTKYIETSNLEIALDAAATSAARGCEQEGAFGYPKHYAG